VLLSAVGATLGIPALVDTDAAFCFQRHIAIIKPDRARVESRFLWQMLRAPTVFERVWSSTTGSAQPTVPLRAIRELPIPLPPLDVQASVMEQLDAADRRFGGLTQVQNHTRAEVDALLPSILDRAFTGAL
jgi:type I restriction enzyme, S subunit